MKQTIETDLPTLRDTSGKFTGRGLECSRTFPGRVRALTAIFLSMSGPIKFF